MKFIAFEGIDGCGKTSIIKELLVHYQDLDPYLYKETDKIFGYYAKYGFTDIKISVEESVHLFYFQRLLNLDEIHHINPKLVICDRYYDSTWVYGGKNKYLYEYNYSPIFTKPDLTIFINPSIITILSRLNDRITRTDISESVRDMFENKDMCKLERIKSSYEELYLKQNDQRKIISLNTDNMTIEDTVDKCISLIDNELESEN